jgi:hypothetical protein
MHVQHVCGWTTAVEGFQQHYAQSLIIIPTVAIYNSQCNAVVMMKGKHQHRCLQTKQALLPRVTADAFWRRVGSFEEGALFALLRCSATGRLLCCACAHLWYSPKDQDVKAGQTHVLCKCLVEFINSCHDQGLLLQQTAESAAAAGKCGVDGSGNKQDVSCSADARAASAAGKDGASSSVPVTAAANAVAVQAAAATAAAGAGMLDLQQQQADSVGQPISEQPPPPPPPPPPVLPQQKQQQVQLAELIARLPIIVCGDFNSLWRLYSIGPDFKVCMAHVLYVSPLTFVVPQQLSGCVELTMYLCAHVVPQALLPDARTLGDDHCTYRFVASCCCRAPGPSPTAVTLSVACTHCSQQAAWTAGNDTTRPSGGASSAGQADCTTLTTAAASTLVTLIVTTRISTEEEAVAMMSSRSSSSRRWS